MSGRSRRATIAVTSEELRLVPTEMLSKEEHRTSQAPPAAATEPDSAQGYRKRLRRLKLGVAAWGTWTILITTLWVVHEWNVSGAFERFGHEGDRGQWNPTLWALGIGISTLVVGIMALAVYFVRQPPRLRFCASSG